MNTTANPDTAVIVPATDDLNDRAYRFGKPLTYLSDRQQIRLIILRSKIHEELHTTPTQSDTLANRGSKRERDQ
jgi:hypothetical protein